MALERQSSNVRTQEDTHQHKHTASAAGVLFWVYAHITHFLYVCVCVHRVTGEEVGFDLHTGPCRGPADIYLSSHCLVPEDKEVCAWSHL